jgi:hypothetical protein
MECGGSFNPPGTKAKNLGIAFGVSQVQWPEGDLPAKQSLGLELRSRK